MKRSECGNTDIESTVPVPVYSTVKETNNRHLVKIGGFSKIVKNFQNFKEWCTNSEYPVGYIYLFSKSYNI